MRSKDYVVDDLMIDRNEHSKIRPYIEVSAYPYQRSHCWDTVCYLPKKLNFTDEQIQEIVKQIDRVRTEGYDEGRLSKLNEFRDVLGLDEVEEN